jgi:cell division protein FtsI (penicillin-binding protein 3)
MRDLKHTARPDAPTRWMRVRVAMLGAVFFSLMLALVGRAVSLQVRQTDRLKGMAEDQYVRDQMLPARRGDIFDRRGVPLAQSVDVDSVWVDPSMLPDLKAASKVLAKALDGDAKELFARLSKSKRFAWVKRQAKPDEVAKVKLLNLPGIGIAKEPRRFYPQRELAAHVIGLVGTDGHGLDGLELAFHDELSGDQATRAGFRDARGRKLFTEGFEDPTSRRGAKLSLTLDRQLQYITEKALTHAVEEGKAIAGTAVMMDPRTGEILALANAPRFNPNATFGATPELLRNRAVTDAFEPGSSFKAFVVAAALDEKLVTPSTEIACGAGAMPIGRQVIHDTHPHGTISVQKVLQVSSNIGAAKIAQLLGRDRLAEVFARFGFGERIGLGLPGEGKGVVPYARAEVQLATEAFGQGLTATAVQVTAAYAALANGGVMMKPYLVQSVVDPDGLVLLENKPTELRRVVSEKSARSVLAMLETVVEKEGTAPRARMADYRVAGKTGTAQKADPVARGYSDKRIASFIGVVPAEDPRLVILVVVDEPKVDTYGGLAAAPAFKEIAAQALAYLGVRPSAGMSAVAAAEPVAPAPAAAKNVVRINPLFAAFDAVTEGHLEGGVRVPDLTGAVGRVAVAQLLDAALEPRLSGSGRVLSQEPPPGAMVERGSRVTLELAGSLPTH